MKKIVKKNQKGFTLIELIVVIAILGVLAMLIVPRIAGQTDKAKETVAQSNATIIADAVNLHNAMVDDKDAIKDTGYNTAKEISNLIEKINNSTDVTGVSVPGDTDTGLIEEKGFSIVVDGNGNASVVGSAGGEDSGGGN